MSNLSTGNLDTDTRVGDHERERAARQLNQAVGQGYLDLDEYERRAVQVFAAQNRHEIRAVLADLPLHRLSRQDPARIARRRARARRGVALHLGGYLTMVAVCLVVWLTVALTAGAWYFWPIWPMLGGAIGLVSHATPVRLCHSRIR